MDLRAIWEVESIGLGEWLGVGSQGERLGKVSGTIHLS